MWDASEQCLYVSEAFFGESGSLQGGWKELPEVMIDARKGADTFDYVEDFFSESH